MEFMEYKKIKNAIIYLCCLASSVISFVSPSYAEKNVSRLYPPFMVEKKIENKSYRCLLDKKYKDEHDSIFMKLFCFDEKRVEDYKHLIVFYLSGKGIKKDEGRKLSNVIKVKEEDLSKYVRDIDLHLGYVTQQDVNCICMSSSIDVYDSATWGGDPSLEDFVKEWYRKTTLEDICGCTDGEKLYLVVVIPTSQVIDSHISQERKRENIHLYIYSLSFLRGRENRKYYIIGVYRFAVESVFNGRSEKEGEIVGNISEAYSIEYPPVHTVNIKDFKSLSEAIPLLEKKNNLASSWNGWDSPQLKEFTESMINEFYWKVWGGCIAIKSERREENITCKIEDVENRYFLVYQCTDHRCLYQISSNKNMSVWVELLDSTSGFFSQKVKEMYDILKEKSKNVAGEAKSKMEQIIEKYLRSIFKKKGKK